MCQCKGFVPVHFDFCQCMYWQNLLCVRRTLKQPLCIFKSKKSTGNGKRTWRNSFVVKGVTKNGQTMTKSATTCQNSESMSKTAKKMQNYIKPQKCQNFLTCVQKCRALIACHVTATGFMFNQSINQSQEAILKTEKWPKYHTQVINHVPMKVLAMSLQRGLGTINQSHVSILKMKKMAEIP